MPKIDIDMFDDSPKVGDKVKVMGKVKSIDEDTGEVDISYDDVSIVKKHKNNNRDDNTDNTTDIVVDDQTMPNTQTSDQALSSYFQSQ